MKPRPSAHTPQFWTIFVFATFCALGVVLLQSGKPADRPTAWTCIGLFGSMTLLTAAWEVTRHWQGEGVRWQLLKIEGVERKVWFFSASKLQQFFLAATTLCIGTTGIFTFILNNSSLHRWEMGIAGIVGLSLAIYLIYCALTRTRGIALLPSGILYLKDKTPLHIPWESIALITSTKVAQDVGHGLKTHLPALGIRLYSSYPDHINELPSSGRRPISKQTRNKLSASKTQTNFELTYLDEALIISVEEAARLFNHFLQNPRDRRELHPEQTQLGFMESLLSNPS